MASAASRLPSDDWRDPTLSPAALAAATFGAHLHPPNTLKKLNVRSISPSSSSSSSDDPSDSPSFSSSARDRRQSQILDRWAARQARGMITTIERQAHQAELSALSSALPPVSARAASLSCSSSLAHHAAHPARKADLPSNVRASSLIQMWRELEAESCPTPRTATASPGPTSHPPPPPSDRSDDSDAAFGEWESDTATATATATTTSVASSMTESEKGKVGSIVKMLAEQQPPVAASSSSPSFPAEQRLSKGNLVRLRSRRDMEDLVVRLEKERKKEIDALADRQPVSRFSYRGRIQAMLRLRFLRQDIAYRDQPQRASRKLSMDLSLSGTSILFLRERFDQRSQHDSSRGPVRGSSSTVHAQFPIDSQGSSYTDPIDQFNLNDSQYQFNIKETFDQRSQRDGITGPVRGSSNTVHVQCPIDSQGSSYMDPIDQFNVNDSQYQFNIRETLDQRSQHDGSTGPIRESSTTVHVQFPIDSQESSYSDPIDQFNVDDSQYQEVVSTRDPENSPPEPNSPQSRSEDLQGSQSLDVAWEDRSLWPSNLEWQRSLDSSPSDGWQGEVMSEELEPYTQQQLTTTGHIWIGEHPNSWRGWGVREALYSDLLENLSDNVEIRDLLERKRVSTSLASDFCDKMNQMILSFLHRQGQQIDEDITEEDEEQHIWRQSYEFHNVDQVASSSSLVPLPYKTFQHEDNWQHVSFSQTSPQNLGEKEVVQDLKTDMAQIRHEISELRKLVESCMQWQTKLQQCIKEEVSSAVRQSVGTENAAQCSKWTPRKKDSCCICYEMQIDSLLYRCGHMCTCFKCAHDLQWNSGRCPICRAPIEDVVRAYSNTRVFDPDAAQ